MNQFSLAIRLFLRDYRSGELTTLLLALVIAVTSSSAISLFADRLQNTMTNQAAEFLAADLVISSSSSIPNEWLERARALDLNQSQTAEFSSVLIEHEQVLLAGVKAVSSNYPLRGHLKTIQNDYTEEKTLNQGPASNTVWVEKRILSALGLKLGDTLNVGEKPFTITQVITYEPDKRGDLYSLSPRVMINDLDLAATQVIQPGSHVHYFAQFAGDSKSLAAFKAWLKPQLNPSQRIMDIHEDRPEVGGAIKRAERYLGLSSIMVVLIAGVAIAMTTRRYTERHFDTTAILRCLGSTQNQIITLFSYQILLLGLFACSLGCLFGWLTQALLLDLLKNLLPSNVAPPGMLALFFGFITGMVILVGFALPPLLRLHKVPALRVLRRDLLPLPASAWLVYGLATVILMFLIGRYTQDARMTVTIIGSGLACLILLGLLINSILLLVRAQLPRFSLSWRLGLQNLIQERQVSVSQILAFSVTLMAMVLCFTVKTDLVDNWRKQLPANAPNHFALNIFPDQLPSVQQDLHTISQSDKYFYPVVSGRLIRINDRPVQQHVTKDSQGQQAVERDLSLTWSHELPITNKIVGGNWWTIDKPNVVSVEQKLAENLGIKLEDVLTFSVGSEQFNAQVSSLRQVPWETLQPNFYMIFPPNTLERFPHSYITSFYLANNEKNSLNAFLKKYPNTMILEVDLMLAQFKMILNQLTSALNYLFYLAFGAGFTVLFAAVYATLDQRIYKGALMRTLGANHNLLNKAHLLEYCMLGFLSGVLAIILAEAIMYCLYQYVLHLDYHINFLFWLLVPCSATGVIGITGFWGLRGVVKTPPLQVLQKL